jgi:hypothetical protein
MFVTLLDTMLGCFSSRPLIIDWGIQKATGEFVPRFGIGNPVIGNASRGYTSAVRSCLENVMRLAPASCAPAEGDATGEWRASLEFGPVLRWRKELVGVEAYESDSSGGIISVQPIGGGPTPDRHVQPLGELRVRARR